MSKMEDISNDIHDLRTRIDELEARLYEANSIISAIRQGEVDALVVARDGRHELYSIESADYTYRILIEKFGEGALSMGYDGLILYCNEAFCALAGLPANKIVGTYFTQYTANDAEFNRLKEAARGDGPCKGELVLDFEGRQLHVIMALTDLAPNVESMGAVITDLTEKRRHVEALEEYRHTLEQKVGELHRTNANLEEFIHVVSHDIKEPLRKMLTYTSHLREGREADFTPEDLRTLALVNNSALRLNSLVDDLVKYTFSAEKVETRSVGLDKVLAELEDDLGLMIADSGARISAGALPEIKGSKVQLRQLFSNLVANAIKYGRKDVPPEITITHEETERPDAEGTLRPYLRISIADNGIGIEKAHLSKIFTIFQRLHMRNEYSGNGIGLAICKKIMENHSGFIEVESTPGLGSVFHLYFPAPWPKDFTS